MNTILTPKLTASGLLLLVNAMHGDTINFTRVVLGTATENLVTDHVNMTAVISPIINAGIKQITKGDTFVRLDCEFTNADVTTGGIASELGVYAKNKAGTEYLYAYANTGESSDYIPASDSGRTVTTSMSVIVAIGDADDVSAELIEQSTYATKEALNDHIHDYNNPHKVTKKQLELDKVENKAFKDQTFTIEDLDKANNVENGDTTSTFGSKMRFFIKQLIKHLTDHNNPHNVKADQIDAIPIAGSDKIHGNLWHQDCGTGERYIGGTMAGNDCWRVGAKPFGADSGALEIATGDNGAEPIVVRQYNGQYSKNSFSFGTYGKAFQPDWDVVWREAYLLDSNGNTSIPGSLIMDGPASNENGWKFIGGNVGVNDWVMIRFGTDSSLNPSAADKTSGFLEFSVADDGNSPGYMEPIAAAQYYGAPWREQGLGTCARRAFVLDTNGNTSFPQVCYAAAHVNSSDRKAKDIHGDIDTELAYHLIDGLDPIFYNFKGQWKEQSGFVAQDVYSLLKSLGLQDNGLYRAAEMTSKDELRTGKEYHDDEIDAHDDKDVKWDLDYSEFIPYLVKVVQDQSRRISELEALLKADIGK